MLQKAAMACGAAFLVLGALGFLPVAAPEGRLLEVFRVDAAGNLIHLATAGVAIVAAFASERLAGEFFRLGGLLYALAAVFGLSAGGEPLLGLLAHNGAGDWLHGAFAMVALPLGFLLPDGRPGGKKYQASL